MKIEAKIKLSVYKKWIQSEIAKSEIKNPTHYFQKINKLIK